MDLYESEVRFWEQEQERIRKRNAPIYEAQECLREAVSQVYQSHKLVADRALENIIEGIPDGWSEHTVHNLENIIRQLETCISDINKLYDTLEYEVFEL